jgi:PGF-pre-PGF domain-containing protein
MEKKFTLLYSFLLIFSLFSIQLAQPQPPVCAWRGYTKLNISATLVDGNTSHIITSYTNGSQATNGTIESTGYYRINIPGNAGDNITLQVCGVNVTQGFQAWSCDSPGYRILNISMNTSADSASCMYACGCSGNYCNSGVCASSPPATTTTTAAPSPGGGGPATTTTVAVTTTTLPPVIETKTVGAITNGTIGNFTFQAVPLTEVLVEVNKTVSNVQLTVTKTDAAPATVAIGAPGYTYAYLTITKTNVVDKDISSVKIKFKVEKSWINTNNIDMATIVLYRYVNGSWVALPTVKLSEDATYVYFEAESPGLSVFAINAQKKAVTTTTVPTTTTTLPTIPTKGIEWVYASIVLIILVVVFFFLMKFPKKK